MYLCIYCDVYIKPSLHSLDESHLLNVSIPFNMTVDLIF